MPDHSQNDLNPATQDTTQLLENHDITSPQSDTPLQMANYLGTGSNPRLLMTLAANGPKWAPYTIDYAHEGGIPYAASMDDGWSTWNVYDDEGNYYGTITISSDNKTVEFDNYVAPNPPTGYYLDGIHLTWNNASSAFNMTVDKIYQPTPQNGPFPDAPRATPATFTGTNTPIKFHTEGNKILDNYGRDVSFKGVARPSLEWNPQGQYLSPDDIANMAKWGANVIRLDLFQGYWFDSADADTKGSYKQIIDAIIYYATQNNMAVILDLHWVEAGHQSNMANQDSIRFWQEVAATYKDFGTVMFELYNEPVNITPDVWLNGDGNYVGYQQLHDAVRNTGADNLVIVNGTDYAYDLSFVTPEGYHVKGKNIVYGSHPYNDKGAPGYTGPGGSFDNCYKGVLPNYPLIFTEFGGNQANEYPNGYQDIYSRIIAYANANNIDYTAFAWWVDPNDPQFPTLISSWQPGPDGKVPGNFGGIDVENDLVKNPPSNFFQPPPGLKNTVSTTAQSNVAQTQEIISETKKSESSKKARECCSLSLDSTISAVSDSLSSLSSEASRIASAASQQAMSTLFSASQAFFERKTKFYKQIDDMVNGNNEATSSSSISKKPG